jgi:hypothetical protein
MSSGLPTALGAIETAIHANEWEDPGPRELAAALGVRADFDELELFRTIEDMLLVARILVDHFVDLPQFCMVRSATDRDGPEDPRLAVEAAVIIAGSKVPGDDVFVAVDVNTDPADFAIKVLDWSKRVPERWTTVTSLRSFTSELARRARRL